MELHLQLKSGLANLVRNEVVWNNLDLGSKALLIMAAKAAVKAMGLDPNVVLVAGSKDVAEAMAEVANQYKQRAEVAMAEQRYEAAAEDYARAIDLHHDGGVSILSSAVFEALASRDSKPLEILAEKISNNKAAQSKLAEMVLDIDTSALLIYRAGWLRDVRGQRNTREAALAKLHATDSAQQVIDKAVQIFGGLGVTVGAPVEALYREVRALRIYEGASEVQKIVIARQHLAQSAG
ncbi:MAG: hypothetical protein IH998_03780 [Proteobacteria bacterium]|nr:hypothetical protein [Pseudomonadota bacterium]